MDFYYMSGSSPCRSVLMTAKTLGVELNKKKVNLMTGEHLKPEYLKLNPQHTVPTLVDHGFALWESRAILVYLAEKYGKNHALYPKGTKERAVVNQRLYFDMGTLSNSFADYYLAQMRFKKPADPEKFKQVETAFELLNKFLEGHTYVAGDELSIADLAILATVSNFDVVGFKYSKYANVAKWYEHLKKTVSGWDENWAGCLEFKAYFQ